MGIIAVLLEKEKDRKRKLTRESGKNKNQRKGLVHVSTATTSTTATTDADDTAVTNDIIDITDIKEAYKKELEAIRSSHKAKFIAFQDTIARLMNQKRSLQQQADFFMKMGFEIVVGESIIYKPPLHLPLPIKHSDLDNESHSDFYDEDFDDDKSMIYDLNRLRLDTEEKKAARMHAAEGANLNFVCNPCSLMSEGLQCLPSFSISASFLCCCVDDFCQNS